MIIPTIMAGSTGLTLADVAHFLIPGRGRNATASGLNDESRARTVYAAQLFKQCDLASVGGVIVASGYKTPGDSNGKPWAAPNTGEVFQGIPEAYAMKEVLLSEGVSVQAIRTEAHSIDTVTNLARVEVEGFIPDSRPVAIVSHREHLRRILYQIAPKTLNRQYLGIVVPEGPDPDKDGPLARMASRFILMGVTTSTERIVELTDKRATRLWNAVNTTKRLVGVSTEYPPRPRSAHRA